MSPYSKTKKLNLLLAGLSRKLRLARPLNMPSNIMIEPTNICNLKCPGCPTGRNDLPFKKGRMELSTFRALLDELGPYAVYAQLWGFGEPFLHSEVFEMVAYCKKFGIEVRLSTNGHLIKALIDERRRQHGLQQQLHLPQVILGEALSELERKPEEHAADGFRGLGVSPGVARGRVRVARTADDLAAVEEGEILVVPSLDPAWTSVFARVAGLVAERGAILSHGAIVTREFALPAVVNIEGATRRLRGGRMGWPRCCGRRPTPPVPQDERKVGGVPIERSTGSRMSSQTGSDPPRPGPSNPALHRAGELGARLGSGRTAPPNVGHPGRRSGHLPRAAWVHSPQEANAG